MSCASLTLNERREPEPSGVNTRLEKKNVK